MFGFIVMIALLVGTVAAGFLAGSIAAVVIGLIALVLLMLLVYDNRHKFIRKRKIHSVIISDF